MPKTLSNTGIATNQTIYAANVTQSIDAFTAAEAYQVSIFPILPSVTWNFNF